MTTTRLSAVGRGPLDCPMHRRDLLRLLSLSTLAGATGCAGQSSPPSAGLVPDVELVLTAAPDEVPGASR